MDGKWGSTGRLRKIAIGLKDGGSAERKHNSGQQHTASTDMYGERDEGLNQEKGSSVVFACPARRLRKRP